MSIQFLKYLLAGMIGTLTHYAVMLFLILVDLDPTPSTAAGALVGAIVNYYLCSRVVFTGHRSSTHFRQARYSSPLKFGMVALSTVAINTVVFDIALRYVSQIIFAQLFSTLAILPIGFLLNRQWSFAPPRSRLVRSS